jgi:hypothetical protein
MTSIFAPNSHRLDIMPPKAEKTAEKTAVQQVKEQIESVAKRMRRDQPVHIQLSNGNSVELKSSLLDTITSGRRFSREAWNDVIDILIRPRFPDVLIDNSDDKFPPLKDKQQCFRLGWSRNSLDYPSISNLIFAIQHSVPKVEIYTVREGFNFKSLHGIKAQIIGEVVGVEWHKLVYTYHQVCLHTLYAMNEASSNSLHFRSYHLETQVITPSKTPFFSICS